MAEMSLYAYFFIRKIYFMFFSLVFGHLQKELVNS